MPELKHEVTNKVIFRHVQAGPLWTLEVCDYLHETFDNRYDCGRHIGRSQSAKHGVMFVWPASRTMNSTTDRKGNITATSQQITSKFVGETLVSLCESILSPRCQAQGRPVSVSKGYLFVVPKLILLFNNVTGEMLVDRHVPFFWKALYFLRAAV